MGAMKSFALKLRRGLRQLWFWDVWHIQPSSPLNARYFRFGQPARIHLHRRLWWHSRYKLPGLLWLPFELGRWAHWRWWAASRKVQAAVSTYGPEVEARFGIPVADQRRRLDYWAKSWCIDPYTAYKWRLYNQDVDGLDIVYDNQTKAYHALENRKTGASKADHRLLGDKIALAEVLSRRGIPMVETVRASNGDWHHLETSLKRYPKLFCKLRSGNQGESAFAVWHAENGLQGLAHNGTVLPNEHAVRSAWRTLTGKGAALVQPFLINHPQLAEAADEAAITMRIVTRMESDGLACWWAELQVPSTALNTGSLCFWRYPVSIEEGAVYRMGYEWFLRQAWQDDYDVLWQKLSAVSHVPHWAQIRKDSLKAHQQLPNVWAIAWDWVLTPEGPVLLEGNGGWGLCEVQQQGTVLTSSDLFGSQSMQ